MPLPKSHKIMLIIELLFFVLFFFIHGDDNSVIPSLFIINPHHPIN